MEQLILNVIHMQSKSIRHIPIAMLFKQKQIRFPKSWKTEKIVLYFLLLSQKFMNDSYPFLKDD